MSSIEPLPQTVSIEYPLKVNSHEKAIAAVGGAKVIAAAATHPDKQLELRLRDDPFHHPINSSRSDATNIVLEIKVPTWALEKAEGNVQKALELSKGDYSAKPMLFSSTNFKFREMADFQYNTESNDLVGRLERSITGGNLRNIMTYTIPRDSELELLPPPRFSQQTQPVFYNYKQPSSVAVIQNDDGEVRLVNKTKAAQLKSHVIKWEDPVPTKPREDLDPNPRQPVKDCIEELKKVFETRPSYTRRAILSLISEYARRSVRYALPYVAYFYKSGPWRAAYVKYGHNPHTDSSMAKFQVEHFRFSTPDESGRPEDAIWFFDGKRFPTTRMLQLCDVSEPFIKNLIDNSTVRSEATESDGWFDKGDMAAIRKILRTELETVRDDREPLSTEKLQELADEARTKESEVASQPGTEVVEEEEEEEEEEQAESG